MCGRYDLSQTGQQLMFMFGLSDLPAFDPNPDIRPTQTAPVIRLRPDGHRECVLMRWGLIPSWAKDPRQFGARLINARAETVATLPAFRSAARARRCLVPADAFYDWSGPRGRKTQHRVALPDGSPLSMAGLWEAWRDAASGVVVETYTIITTDANEALRPIHDRMPVILPAADGDAWLREARQELLRPYPGELVIEPPAPLAET